MTEINLFIQSFSNEYADIFFKIISFLITDIPLVLFLSYIYWCVNKEDAFKAGVVLLTSMQLNFIMKNIFKVERPYIKNSSVINKDIKYGYGYSFPSNHSQIAATILTLFNRYLNMGKHIIWGTILVLMIAFSRIYLGVHSIIDVFCGLLFGWAISVLTAPLVEKILSKNKYLIFIFGIFGIISTFLLMDEDGLKILLLFIGFVSGYFMEIKITDYKICEKMKYNIMNYFIGILGFIPLYVFIPGNIKYILIGMWVTLFAPAIFKLISVHLINRKEKRYEHK